jgi:voltage-gated sodium channel
MFTSLFGDAYKNNDVEVDYFSTLVKTTLTLEQLMTMDNWNQVTESVMEFYSWSWTLIILYIFLSSFIMVALTIAVICEGYLDETKTTKRRREKESVTQSEEDICRDKFISIETRMNDIHQQLKLIIDGNGMLEFHEDDNDDNISYSTPLSKSTSLLDCLEASSHECKNQTIEDHEIINNSPMSETLTPTIANTFSFHSNDNNSNEAEPYTFKESYRKFRSVCGKIAQNFYFELLIFALVVINTILLIVQLYAINEDLIHALDIVDKVLLSIFTLETIVNLIYHHLAFFRQPWLVFDFVVILGSWIFASFSFLRALRVLRILLLIPRFKQVHVLFLAIANVLPHVGGVLILFMIVLYVFGIIFTVLLQNYEVDGNYFTRLDKSLLTLFQFSTMEDWSSIAREYEKVTSAWTPQLMFLYVAISGYILLNLMIGVIAVAIEQVNKMIFPHELDEDHSVDDRDKELERVQEIQIDILNMIKTLRRESCTSEVPSKSISIGNRVLQTISKKEEIQVVISKLS